MSDTPRMTAEERAGRLVDEKGQRWIEGTVLMAATAVNDISDEIRAAESAAFKRGQEAMREMAAVCAESGDFMAALGERFLLTTSTVPALREGIAAAIRALKVGER